jgi:hypothetical protein
MLQLIFLTLVKAQLLLLSNSQQQLLHLPCHTNNYIVSLASFEGLAVDGLFQQYIPSVDYDVDFSAFCDMKQITLTDASKVSELISDDTLLVIKKEIPKLHLQKRQLSTKPYSKRSLFEQFTFFNSAVFMGIFTMVLVGLLLYYAMGMLLGLQTPTKFEVPKK